MFGNKCVKDLKNYIRYYLYKEKWKKNLEI